MMTPMAQQAKETVLVVLGLEPAPVNTTTSGLGLSEAWRYRIRQAFPILKYTDPANQQLSTRFPIEGTQIC
jgi:hypothetical protein